MRMSCNGCRVLRKGCSENCSIRPCLQWIKTPESQANATVFLAKFYGRAGLMNLINAGPDHLPIFRSLLYEACGRIVNPIYGSVGLLWSGSWQLCQAAVEAVLKGAPITPINSETAATGDGPPLKAYDIRHVSKDENSVASNDGGVIRPVKTRCRFKRSSAKAKASKGIASTVVDESTRPLCSTELNRSSSGESSLSHQSDSRHLENESKETESMISVETAEVSPPCPVQSVLFRSESTGRESVAVPIPRSELALELTLGMEPVLRAQHVIPMKKRKIETDVGLRPKNETCNTVLGLDFAA
ncbi:LOB domain-containing protein 41 [Cucumis melo var. makuwa]|uniref:LOB domain-containing protein 41 n=1 Tax=Cucumis melo var. makuwa TaxID=1194695 RepID=A0A5D3CIA7_CUCMM|nr:LOB domain-containing protein 41 [Cucumis melo var. makuwa]TYK11647.1 LOB domain-containing protein 41 [Cucumis melo var. makuwa]